MPRILKSSKGQMALGSIIAMLLIWMGLPDAVAESRGETIAELLMTLITVVTSIYSLVTGWEDYAAKRDTPPPQVQQQIEQAVEKRVTEQVAQSVQQVRETAGAELQKRVQEAIRELQQRAGQK